MCGIADSSPRPRPLDDLILSMTTAVRHRGPDDEGFTIFSPGVFRRQFSEVWIPQQTPMTPGLPMLPYEIQNRFPMPSLPSATAGFRS